MIKLVEKERPYTPLSSNLKPLHPYCNQCRWRKGGVDSWNGSACKCGHSAAIMVSDAQWEESIGFFVNGNCLVEHRPRVEIKNDLSPS